MLTSRPGLPGPPWRAGQAWLPWRGGGPVDEPAPCRDGPPGAFNQQARTAPALATCADLHLARWSAGMPVGPGVDEVEHGAGRLGRHEAEHLLQDRVHDGVKPLLYEGLKLVLGLPDIDITQPRLGAPGQVG